MPWSFPRAFCTQSSHTSRDKQALYTVIVLISKGVLSQTPEGCHHTAAALLSYTLCSGMPVAYQGFSYQHIPQALMWCGINQHLTHTMTTGWSLGFSSPVCVPLHRAVFQSHCPDSEQLFPSPLISIKHDLHLCIP